MKLFVLLFLIFCPLHEPRKGEWICWYTSAKDSHCGTYGFSKSKDIAKEKGFSLCEKYCEERCEFDYCEKL